MTTLLILFFLLLHSTCKLFSHSLISTVITAIHDNFISPLYAQHDSDYALLFEMKEHLFFKAQDLLQLTAKSLRVEKASMQKERPESSAVATVSTTRSNKRNIALISSKNDCSETAPSNSPTLASDSPATRQAVTERITERTHVYFDKMATHLFLIVGISAVDLQVMKVMLNAPKLQWVVFRSSVESVIPSREWLLEVGRLYNTHMHRKVPYYNVSLHDIMLHFKFKLVNKNLTIKIAQNATSEGSKKCHIYMREVNDLHKQSSETESVSSPASCVVDGRCAMEVTQDSSISPDRDVLSSISIQSKAAADSQSEQCDTPLTTSTYSSSFSHSESSSNRSNKRQCVNSIQTPQAHIIVSPAMTDSCESSVQSHSSNSHLSIQAEHFDQQWYGDDGGEDNLYEDVEYEEHVSSDDINSSDNEDRASSMVGSVWTFCCAFFVCCSVVMPLISFLSMSCVYFCCFEPLSISLIVICFAQDENNEQETDVFESPGDLFRAREAKSLQLQRECDNLPASNVIAKRSLTRRSKMFDCRWDTITAEVRRESASQNNEAKHKHRLSVFRRKRLRTVLSKAAAARVQKKAVKRKMNTKKSRVAQESERAVLCPDCKHAAQQSGLNKNSRMTRLPQSQPPHVLNSNNHTSNNGSGSTALNSNSVSSSKASSVSELKHVNNNSDDEDSQFSDYLNFHSNSKVSSKKNKRMVTIQQSSTDSDSESQSVRSFRDDMSQSSEQSNTSGSDSETSDFLYLENRRQQKVDCSSKNRNRIAHNNGNQVQTQPKKAASMYQRARQMIDMERLLCAQPAATVTVEVTSKAVHPRRNTAQAPQSQCDDLAFDSLFDTPPTLVSLFSSDTYSSVTTQSAVSSTQPVSREKLLLQLQIDLARLTQAERQIVLSNSSNSNSCSSSSSLGRKPNILCIGNFLLFLVIYCLLTVVICQI